MKTIGSHDSEEIKGPGEEEDLLMMYEGIEKDFMDNPIDNLEDPTDLPTSLIVTNVDNRIFSTGELKDEFERLFCSYADDVTFQYYKSFRRARVNFGSPLTAAKARIQCHQMKLGDALMNCYFCQSTSSTSKEEHDDYHLQPPSPVRQFLISPPASPPVGWKPVDEAQPVMNLELISALANLAPGEIHELHPASDSHPGIVVHICEEQGTDELNRMKIQQTKRPPVRTSSEDSVESI